MVYSTRRFVLCLTLCHFVLVFFSPFSIAIISLGEKRANLSAFRTFVWFVLVWICRFPLPLGVCDCGTPWTFLLLFFIMDRNKNTNRNETKTSPEYISISMCSFTFVVIWVVIFNVKKQYVTGFQFQRKFVKIIQKGMANLYIEIIGWQALEPSLIKDRICQQLIMQWTSGDSL